MIRKTNDKSFSKRATSGVVWSFLREGVSEILVFPASMVLARLLTPEEFGVAAAANFFTLLASRLSELGFNAAIVRAKVLEPIHLSTVFCVNIVVGIVTFTVLTTLAPTVSRFYGIPGTGEVVSIAAVAFLIGPFGAVPAALLTRDLQYQKATFVDWSQLVVFSLAGVVFAWMGFSYTSMVYGRLLAIVTANALRISFARWRPSLRFSWSALKEILSFGAGVHAKRLLDYAAQQGDNLVVGKVMGMGALGLYDKAFSTMNRFLSRLNNAGPGVMFRIFSVIHEDADRFRRAYQKVIMSASLVGFPVFAGLYVTAPQLMLVLFGDQWVESAAPFRVLCISAVFKLLNSYASSGVQAAGRVWSEVWRQALLLVIMIVGIFVLRPWGPTGAALAVTIATVVMTMLMHTLLVRATGLGFGDIVRPLMPALGCSAIVAFVAVLTEDLARRVAGDPSAWTLLAVQAASCAVVGAAFVLFAPMRDLRQLVREVSKDAVPAALQRHRWAQAYWRWSDGY